MNIVIYTHSDFSDIWPITFNQGNDCFPQAKITVFVDKKTDFELSNTKYIYYNESLSYTERVFSCLDQIENETIIYLHEDMILYKKVEIETLKEFFNLVNCDKADFIKLIKAGINLETNKYIYPNLIKCPPDNMFSIQPTVCKTEKLKKLFENVKCSIWDFEKIVSNICFIKNYSNCFMASTDKDIKRGIYHYDSNIFPYIATAIVKGKWNYSEYKNELDCLFDKYKINKNKRGLT